MAKVKNINQMRKAVIKAHNANNSKAIDSQRVLDADIDNRYFIDWKKDVNNLRTQVLKYVRLQKSQRTDDTISDKDIQQERNKIFPLWKVLLSCCERTSNSSELHASEFDIDNLVGFSWIFTQSANGTVEAPQTEILFRKDVESLLGCIIAKNTMLTDVERDKLQRYCQLMKSIENVDNQLAGIDKEMETYKALREKVQNEPHFVEHIDNLIAGLEENKNTINSNLRKNKNELNGIKDDVRDIESKVKKIKIQ